MILNSSIAVSPPRADLCWPGLACRLLADLGAGLSWKGADIIYIYITVIFIHINISIQKDIPYMGPGLGLGPWAGPGPGPGPGLLPEV